MKPATATTTNTTPEAELLLIMPPPPHWGSENAPFVPQLYLLVMMTLGSLLAFVGTPVMYVAYAATQQELYLSRNSPLPIITNMFCDWPMLSSAVTGVGLSLLFSGMAATAIARIPLEVKFAPRTAIIEFSILGQVALWLLIPSSMGVAPAYQDAVSLVHYGATFLLMASSIYALYQAANVCVYFAEVLGMDGSMVAAASWTRWVQPAQQRIA